jgi:hypothetical protein
MKFDRRTPAFSKEAFENAILDNGIQLVHYKALPCPVGMADQHTTTFKSHPPHDNCMNGYIFEKAGLFTCLFNNNPASFQLLDPGLLTGSTVHVTFPSVYDDTQEEVTIGVQDRLQLKDPCGYVTAQQRFTKSGSKTDYLHFQPTKIESLWDANGIKYHPGDFSIQNGNLTWNNKAPPPGTVCSIRYLYLPYWWVMQLIHEIRIAQIVDGITQDRTLTRMPYSALCRRENAGRSAYQDSNAPVKSNSVLPPDDSTDSLLA